jgi:carboxymethylenebutenolidase
MAGTAKIKTGTLNCASGGTTYVAQPEGQGKYPCVIVIHERYGLVKHTLDLCDKFAQSGYIGIAPNLFWRHPDIAAVNRGESRCDVIDKDAVGDLDSAVEAVAREIKSADTKRLAVMGVCQSGRYPLVYAAYRPLGACVVFYGAAQEREWEKTDLFPVPLEELMARIDCPVLGVFGEADHVIHINEVRKFRDILEDNRKSYRIHLFPKMPHGWLNDTMPGRYRPKEARTAWNLTLKFLEEKLGSDDHRRNVSWEFLAESSPDYDFSKNVRLE